MRRQGKELVHLIQLAKCQSYVSSPKVMASPSITPLLTACSALLLLLFQSLMEDAELHPSSTRPHPSHPSSTHPHPGPSHPYPGSTHPCPGTSHPHSESHPSQAQVNPVCSQLWIFQAAFSSWIQLGFVTSDLGPDYTLTVFSSIKVLIKALWKKIKVNQSQ